MPTTTVHYTTLPNTMGGPVAIRQGGVSRFPLLDLQGHVRQLTDSTGAVTDTFTPDAWGVEKASTGSTVNPYKAFGGWGYYRDKIERVYVRARHLRVDQGRWISRDPIGFQGGDWNLYRYVEDQPVRYYDPRGTDYVTPCLSEDEIRRQQGSYPPEGARWPLPLKPCNPMDTKTRQELINQLGFSICMEECECNGAAGAHCLSRFPDLKWTRPNCGDPRKPRDPGLGGDNNIIAVTYCVRGCGTCQGEVFYGDLFLQANGCLQRCVQQHEYVHADYCDSQKPHRLPTTECEAYAATIQCIRRYLRGGTSASISDLFRRMSNRPYGLRA